MLKNAGVSSAVAEEIVGHDNSEMNRISSGTLIAALQWSMH